MVETRPEVAVLGMSARASGAEDVEAFWGNLLGGIVALQPRERSSGGTFKSGPAVRRREFDRHLFGLGSAEALILDPQVRALLELSWSACEDAALTSLLDKDSTVGVYVGAGPEEYLQKQLLPHGAGLAGYSEQELVFANSRDFLATRLSHSLDFTGPSLTVQTACSTSLVAVHQAVRALLTYECDFAIAGGATVHVDDAFRHSEGGVLSEDGACRSFDRAASGAVPSSGGGIVVLCRVEDLSSHASPRAFILGSAVNNDGADRQNFAAPSPRGQAAVITEALSVAEVDASDVDFIETHGTGTRLGDQIELETLQRIYGSAPRSRPASLGALKVSIGHTDAGAGVLGLVKAVLAVESGVIPGTPAQDGDEGVILQPDSGLVLPRESSAWPGTRRTAAVSSFGLGGTNAHVILSDVGQSDAETPPSVGGDSQAAGPRLVALSGADATAPARVARQLLRRSQQTGGASLSDMVDSLQTGRSQLRWRTATVATGSNEAEIAAALEALVDEPATDSRGRGAPSAVALVLPGQGGDLDDVGRALMQTSPSFCAHFDECAAAIVAAGGQDPRRGWSEGASADSGPEAVQPLVFALGVALGRTLTGMGVGFAALIGHSMGEFAAAVLADVMPLDVGAEAVVRRARATLDATPGGMTAVAASLPVVDGLAKEFGVTVCAHNGPDAFVLGGPRDRLDALDAELTARGLRYKRLNASHAFHTESLVEARDAVFRYLGTVTLQEPSLPVYSTVTGARLTGADATSAMHWATQIVRPIQFEGAVTAALDDCGLETLVVAFRAGLLGGPLHGIVQSRSRDVAIHEVLGRTAGEEHHELLRTVGSIWARGQGELTSVDGTSRSSTRMPAYPFIDEEHWVEGAETSPAAGEVVVTSSGSDAQRAGAHNTNDVPKRSLREIWLGVLDGEAASPGNFFLDGGTSLQAAQLIAQVNSEFLVDSRLSHLYESPDFAEFSSVIDRLSVERDEDLLLALLDEIEGAGGAS
ncbi:beta-ketoacyl synthase N-terminal-like domain-containing protein [Curtobacterium sp. 24E2]|nr:acyltransferase domain-containing protein [Curtobacterium sp. 24E2]